MHFSLGTKIREKQLLASRTCWSGGWFLVLIQATRFNSLAGNEKILLHTTSSCRLTEIRTTTPALLVHPGFHRPERLHVQDQGAGQLCSGGNPLLGSQMSSSPCSVLTGDGEDIGEEREEEGGEGGERERKRGSSQVALLIRP